MKLPDSFQQYLNDENQLVSWPSKPKYQKLVLDYLADQFELDVFYTEKQVNDLLSRYHTFSDPALLRRELYVKKLLDRDPDGKRYWKTSHQIPSRWSTERLTVHDAHSDELPELRKIHASCSYISQWTGLEHPHPDPILAELNHEDLPPNGDPKKHRIQSILRGERIVGYLVCYHGYPDERTFWIAVLAIHPEHQKQAFGREVANGLIAEIEKLRAFSQFAGAVSIKNWPALRFWFMCGLNTILKLKLEGFTRKKRSAK